MPPTVQSAADYYNKICQKRTPAPLNAPSDHSELAFARLVATAPSFSSFTAALHPEYC
jgi:hypothetical protein